MKVEDQKVPAMWEHTQKVWLALDEQAELLESSDGAKPLRVWEGFTTKLFNDLEIPIPYYGDILHALTEMGCIQQIRRGGRTSRSKWAVFKAPELAAYMKVRPATPRSNQKKQLERIEQRVRDLTNQIPEANVASALVAIQLQLDVLDERVKTLEEWRGGQELSA